MNQSNINSSDLRSFVDIQNKNNNYCAKEKTQARELFVKRLRSCLNQRQFYTDNYDLDEAAANNKFNHDIWLDTCIHAYVLACYLAAVTETGSVNKAEKQHSRFL